MMKVRCPNCHDRIDVANDAELAEIVCSSCGSQFRLIADETATYNVAPSRTVGRFEVLDLIGSGGFGSVWTARDTHLDRTVALKVPRKGKLNEAESQQFLREARAAAQLNHPNIVAIHEVGLDHGQVYIVSDYVEGLTLAEWLVGQQLTAQAAAKLCIILADALHHAHAAGVVHRDLKPSNVIMDAAHEPHITDFGLAKREAGEVTMTMAGQVLGTPAYMSPEQAKGEAHNADRRSDVYSLGVIMYELLTGHKPFRGNVRMMLKQVVEDDAPSLRKLNSSIPKDLDTVCSKCLQKEPEQRYQTMELLAEELARFLRGEPVHTRPVTTLERSYRWSRRNPVVAMLAAILVVTLLSLGFAGGLAVIRSQQLEDQLRVSTARSLAAQASMHRSEQPVLGLLLALEAVETTRRHDGFVAPAARDALFSATSDIGGLPLMGHHRRMKGMAISADGNWLVTANRDGTARRWDLAYLTTADNRTRKDVSSSSVVLDHDGPVEDAVITFDNKWLYTASRDTMIRKWRLDSSNVAVSPRPLAGHTGKVWRLAVSHQWLASGSGDETVRLWDLQADDPRPTNLGGRAGTIWSLAFSANGQKLAAGSEEGVIRVWDMDKNPAATAPTRLAVESGTVWSLAISVDNRWLVSGHEDGTVRIWDLSADDVAASAHILSMHTEDVTSVVITRDGRWIVSGSYDRTARLWSLPGDSSVTQSIELVGHTAGIEALALSDDDRWLATVSRDATARLWDLRRSDVAETSVVLRGHEQTVYRAAFHPDGQWLATGSWDGTARLWNLAAMSVASSTGTTASTASLDLTSRGKLLIASRGATLHTSDVSTGAITSSVALGDSNRGVQVARYSPDGHWLAVGYVDGSVELRQSLSAPTHQRHEHEGPVTTLRFSADSHWLATGGEDGTIRLWDVGNGPPDASELKLSLHRSPVESLAFSPDGRWLCTSSGDEGGAATILWNLEAEDVADSAVTLVSQGRVVSTAVGPNSRWLAAGSYDGPVWLWDLTSLDIRSSARELAGHGWSVVAAAISPDARWLITGDWDGKAQLWELTHETPESTAVVLEGHRANITSLSISDDSKWAVTGSEDKTARVWDLNSPNPSATSFALRGHDGGVSDVAFYKSRWVVTHGEDGVTRIWDLDLDAVIEKARSIAGRELTVQERRRYIHDFR